MNDSASWYQVLANAVLMLHVGVVLFIVGGLIVILIGGALRWQWVRNGWFRGLHLAAMSYVAIQSWFGLVCPLTTLELWLRAQAGQRVYEGDFIAYWLSKLLFFDAPPWVFIVAYTGFALVVASSWYFVRPVWRRRTPLTPNDAQV